MPKYVLSYVLDKGQCFNLESVFTQSYFPNKVTVTSVWNTVETGDESKIIFPISGQTSGLKVFL